jgi:exonuclease VII small subunit
LDDPRTAEALERLLERLDLVAFAVEAADGFLRRGEQLTDNIHDALQEATTAAPAVDTAAWTEQLPQLVPILTKLSQVLTSPAFTRLLGSGLFERLAAPATLTALQQLLDHLPLLAFVVESFDGLLRRGEELTENVAESLHEARRLTLPFEAKTLQQILNGVPKVIDAVTALIHAGLFDPEVVAVLVEVGRQMAGPYNEAKYRPDSPVGPWGLFKALRDPDVQRALGVGLYIVKRYGQTFNRSEVSPPPAHPMRTANGA